MFGTTFSEPWTERLQTQPQLSSSSSAAAEEFPARVLQQIVSHHLRCLCKYPSRRKHRSTHQLSVGLSLNSVFPLSASYLPLVNLFFLFVFLFFFVFLKWEKEKHHCTKYKGNHMKMLVNLSHHNCTTSINLGHAIQHVWFDSITQEQMRSILSFHVSTRKLSQQPVKGLLLYCKIHSLTNGALLIQMYTNTDCAWFHIYIHKPLGCYCLVCLTINRVGLNHKIIWPAHSFLCLLRDNRHLKTHVHIYK